MSFTNKVSNIIKTKIANNLISGFVNNAIGQPKKLAAKLANKSPLDLSKSPVAHMEAVNNPYTYGSVYYPQETSQLGEGHYIIFDIIENNKTNYGDEQVSGSIMGGDLHRSGGTAYPESLGTVGERKLGQGKRIAKLKEQGFQTSSDVVRKQKSGMAQHFQTHSRLADSIILYTPPTGNKFEYKVGYENVDTGIAGLAAGLLDLNNILGVAGGVGKTFLENVSKAAIEIALPGFGGAIDKALGRSVNPNAELVFKNVPFRTFSYPYEFSPKNEKEKEDVQKILSMFKFHMMPEKFSEGYLAAPAQFQITYMYRDGANMYIPKISRCALTDMTVDYSPEGVFTTFKGDDKGAAPVLTKMDLTFTEMEIMTKETIAAGF
tara:strand:+ start:1779 stop:2909 length:1131 start_codon:yes stop_codon:yes gene_type:complete